MAKVVARYGGYYGTHIGGEGAQIEEELDKALKITAQVDRWDLGATSEWNCSSSSRDQVHRGPNSLPKH